MQRDSLILDNKNMGSMMSYLENLITSTQCSDDAKQLAFIVLGYAASNGSQAAVSTVRNLLAYPQTQDILKTATIGILGSRKPENLYPIINTINKFIYYPGNKGNAKQQAREVLTSLAWFGIQPAIQALERLIHITEKQIPNIVRVIADRHVSDDFKKDYLLKIYEVVYCSPICMQATEKLLAVLNGLIIDPCVADDVKDLALKIIKAAAQHSNHPSLKLLERLVPVLGIIIADSQASDALKETALEAIWELSRGHAHWYHEPVLYSSEIKKLMPIIEDLFFSECSENLKYSIFKVFRSLAIQKNKSALLVWGGVISLVENLISCRSSHENNLVQKVLKIYGVKDNTFRGGMLVFKKLIIDETQIAPLLLRQALERLVPFFKICIDDNQVSDDLRQDCIEMLGLAAAEGIQTAVDVIEETYQSEKRLSDLKKFIINQQTPHIIKQKMIAAVSSGLSLNIKGPTHKLPKVPYTSVSLSKILKKLPSAYNPEFIARSLVYNLNDDKILVIKILKKFQDPISLVREAFWINHLRKLSEQGNFKEVRFDIPEVLTFSGSCVIRLTDIPLGITKGLYLHPKKYSLCFIVHKDYFNYLNQVISGEMLSSDHITEDIARCSFLLGYLTSLGIIHTAPVPLFHTTLQSRLDDGLYLWWLRGRLENWLTSCDYPNLGKTGIRDFEHFISWGVDDPHFRHQGRTGLYRYMGEHLLSLILIAGSYFRNKNRKMVGFDNGGNFINARGLFDRKLFKEIIRQIFLHYYHGFVGKEYENDFPFNLDIFVQKIIEEMGVDKYMEDVFRKYFQEILQEERIKDILSSSGYSKKDVQNFGRCKRDILVLNGPHLQSAKFSVQIFSEIIDVLEIEAALCVIGRYAKK